jgi:hypothetical protein
MALEVRHKPVAATRQSRRLQGKAQSYKVSEGIWELSIRGDAKVEDFAVFALMAVLGFAVLV